MADKFNLDIPFQTRPPRLKDLVNSHLMGEVWLRDSPFGPVTDSIIISEKFNIKHSNVLRAINKCRNELSSNSDYNLENNLIEGSYVGGAKGKERKERKVDITEFGLALLLLYINSPKARQISAEILYRFLILKTYVCGLNQKQLGAIKGYYRSQIKEE